jgi:hypothetical protein
VVGSPSKETIFSIRRRASLSSSSPNWVSFEPIACASFERGVQALDRGGFVELLF